MLLRLGFFRPCGSRLGLLPLVASLGLLSSAASPLLAASIAPPMLDITRQCSTTHRSAASMSECVVAESEARAELLQNWKRYSDAGAERCLTESQTTRKGRKQAQTYDAIAKCLSVETASLPPLPPAGTASPESKGFGSMFKSFFRNDNAEK